MKYSPLFCLLEARSELKQEIYDFDGGRISACSKFMTKFFGKLSERAFRADSFVVFIKLLVLKRILHALRVLWGQRPRRDEIFSCIWIYIATGFVRVNAVRIYVQLVVASNRLMTFEDACCSIIHPMVCSSGVFSACVWRLIENSSQQNSIPQTGWGGRRYHYGHQ